MVVQIEGRECWTQSTLFKGICFRNRICDSTCHAKGTPSKLRMFIEGFMYGIARGLLHAIGVRIYNGSEEMLEGATENVEIPPKPSPYPNEIVQDNGINYSESVSDDDVTGSISFHGETIEDPLL
ncbi:hypothetical protein P8452_00853 [Trifolium repens]|nr:hypothetical protein P8452_00853 [Trifolium repens]